ncbi:COR domain-containing protein [Vibrio scophthalmi]|uniref:COR domain-containing protein n=1 Tax=Vibrio scophthalmi TaxID=45658 RepID=UPI0038737708
MLDNIYTKMISSISIYQYITEINISKPCLALKSLTIVNHSYFLKSSKRIATENKPFKISLLSNFPCIQNLNVRGVDIIDDSDRKSSYPSLKNLMNANSETSNINFITKIPNIELLHVYNCNIENIEALVELKNLNNINLTNNKIIGIPPELSKKFTITAKPNRDRGNNLAIGNNPLISPPIEIVERGESAVRPYFDSMIGEMEELNEAKIIFLGNGEVGKTSLMKALSGQDFDAEEATTHGINICKYNVPINEQRSIDAAIWDFGGQQIMHATHQLFLSRRCVYVLVINDRRDDLQQEQKIEYWLQQVQTFGTDSKVIIIRNKSDMFSLNNVPEGKLKAKFSNLIAIESVSCKTGDNIDRVRNLLNDQVRQLPMRKVCLAKNWIKIKQEIKDLSYKKDHLPLSTYTEICIKNEVTDGEAQKTLRQLLHDLSVIIAFEELSDFNMGILNPHWITDGIYTIINSDALEGNRGYIKISEVQAELDRVHPDKYTNKARFIIESMMHFELCHSIGSSKSNTYLVPNLLPNEVRDRNLTRGDNTMRFVFKYDNLLPPSLFPKLLVRMNSQISADKRWRTGAIMTDVDLDVQARVEVDSVAKEINIIVTGTQTRAFFSIIRHNIRNLNNPSVEALGVRELVPLGESGEHVDYEELIGLEVMGQTDYISGRLKENFSVSGLLSGIESRVETERSVARQREDIRVSVEVKTGDVNVTTGDITNTVTSSSEQTQTATQSQHIDITIELKGLKGTADYVLDDLKDDAIFEIENERERSRFIKECDKVQVAIGQIQEVNTPEEATENLGNFSRIQDFLSNALEGTGKVGDAMQSLGDNISKVRDLAKKYNKVASFLGLPIVPEILL